MVVYKDTNYRTFPFDNPLFRVFNNCVCIIYVLFWLALDIKVLGLILRLGGLWCYGCG